jgi:protein-tyrosine kinase
MDSVGRAVSNRDEQYIPSDVRIHYPIGVHVRDSGLLTQEQIEQVLVCQRQSGLKFGEAATLLRLLTSQQVSQLLREQFDIRSLAFGQSPISSEVLAAYQPESAGVKPLRSLRTVLTSQYISKDAKGYALAVVSTRRGDGRSVTVANLAVLFSQIGMRTIVVDADLRFPRQREIFGLPNKSGLSSALARHPVNTMIERVSGLGSLAVLPAGARPPAPDQLLGRPVFSTVLGDLKKQFDVVILDSPATDNNVDAILVAQQATHTLVLSRKGRTTTSELTQLLAQLQAVRATVIGTILRTD